MAGILFSLESSPDFYNVTLCLLHLGENYQPLGKEEKIQTGNVTNLDAAWLPDGGEFVFGSGTGTSFGLWRIAVSKNAIPRRINLEASSASAPAISRLGNRLAFEVGKWDLNIWRIDLKARDHKPSTPYRFIASTQLDLYPDYSPDGRRIAFTSARSGTDEIWVSDSDGSRPTQLTSFAAAGIYGPHWSPDNQNIAFTAVKKGTKEDIYSIGVNGGPPPSIDERPG